MLAKGDDFDSDVALMSCCALLLKATFPTRLVYRSGWVDSDSAFHASDAVLRGELRPLRDKEKMDDELLIA